MRKVIWNKRPVEKETVARLQEAYGIDPVTASVLVRRGVKSGQEIKFYLEKDAAFLHNPFLFEDMDTAVERVHEAVNGGEFVWIFGDRDVDGMTSTVLLKEALDELGLQVFWSLPEGDEPYGITIEGVDACAKEGCTLIFAVDCGISNAREISYAQSLGIDTVILDHHLPQDQLPPALAVINPKIEGSGYPFRDLAGCGVTAKFIWALKFSQTPLYHQEMVFLHAHPGNDTVIIEAALYENLVELERVVEEVNPRVLPPEQSRLWNLLTGREILVYDAPQEMRQLKAAFGDRADIHLNDTADEIWKVFPPLAGKGLVQLKEKSRNIRYCSHQAMELDVFISLFTAYLYRQYPQLSAEYVKCLDLVAVGTIADMMPMKDENRILVRHGLEMLKNQHRSSMRTFLFKRNLAGKQLSTVDIGWQISPLLNAAGRLGVPRTAAELLLSTDPEQQEQLVDQLVELNKQRKKLGEDAWSRLFPMADKSYAASGERMILVQDRELNRGITGIIAARLMNSFNVPSIVIAHVEDKLVGSMRSGKQVHVKEFLSQFDDILTDYGGHQCAGGFSLEPDLLDMFMRQVKERMTQVEPSMEVHRFEIDAEIPNHMLDPKLIRLVEHMEPYGEENPPLLFFVRQVVVEEITQMGNTDPQHLKLLVSAGSHRWPAVFWRSADRLNQDFREGDRVDILFRLGRNYFRNTETLQLTILDINRSSEAVLTNYSE